MKKYILIAVLLFSSNFLFAQQKKKESKSYILIDGEKICKVCYAYTIYIADKSAEDLTSTEKKSISKGTVKGLTKKSIGFFAQFLPIEEGTFLHNQYHKYVLSQVKNK